MSRFLDRLGRFCARRHWLVIGTWVVMAAALVVANRAADGQPVDTYTIPGTQSQEAADLLEQHFPQASGSTARVVFEDADGVCGDPAPAIARSVKRIGKLPHVTAALDPCQAPQNAAFESSSGEIAYTTVQYDVQAQNVGSDALDLLAEATKPATKAGVRAEYGGAVIDFVNADTSSTDSDAIGLIAAAIILAFAFGSLVAMLLPIGTAVFGLGIGLTLIYLLAAWTDVGTLAPIFGTMIGLGVGIDYSLFVVTRHRQNLAAGMEMEASIAHAVGTSGSAVVFAGVTVIIAITGLRLAQLPYITTLGDTAAVVVAVMVLAAITLLPALTGLVGRRINSLRIPMPGRKRADDPERSAWATLARTVCGHPWLFGSASVALLLVLAIPLNSMELGIADDGTDPKSTTQRQAYDLLTKGFGPGVNGPLIVTVEIPKDATGANKNLMAIGTDVSDTRDVATAFPPQTSPDGRVALLYVIPDSAPESGRTERLVSDLRQSVLPDATRGTGLEALVGGVTAAYVDLSDRVQSRLPWFIGAVVLLSFLVLMFAFHSLVVPLTAAIMNLLSVAAAYGVVVAVFQWGWGRSLLGVEQEVPISPFVPMMMFAILFGLSMDYQVFLLTRVREEYDRSGDARGSVVSGVASTARVITSAALIMIAVFLSFMLDPQPTVKMFGLGLAVAVFLDATIVRLVLVPSVMEILGGVNWWLPRWLDRILPRVALD
jgi:RND superfamily putative drug exporter